MGLAFVNYWRGAGNAPALPAGLQPRDLMILVALSDDASSLLPAPAGWSSIFGRTTSVGGGRYSTQAAVKYAQAGEAAPAMGAVANQYDAIIAAYRGNIGPRFVSACTDWATPIPGASPYAVTLPDVGDGDQIGIACGSRQFQLGPPVTSDDAAVDLALGPGAGDLDFTFAFLHAVGSSRPIDASLTAVTDPSKAMPLLLLSLLTQTDTGLTMLL